MLLWPCFVACDVGAPESMQDVELTHRVKGFRGWRRGDKQADAFPLSLITHGSPDAMALACTCMTEDAIHDLNMPPQVCHWYHVT